jgi:hypothetical protein
MRTPRDGLRYVYDLSVSGAIGSAFLLGLIQSGNIFWTGLYFGWYAGVNITLHRHLNDALGLSLVFYVWCLALILVIASLLRLLSLVTSCSEKLRTIIGVVVVAAPPACFWVIQHYRSDLYSSNMGLWLEGFFAIGFSIVYARKRWWPPTWTGLFLAIHTGLWIHAYEVMSEGRGSQFLTPPISAGIATVLWLFYLRSCREERALKRL